MICGVGLLHHHSVESPQSGRRFLHRSGKNGKVDSVCLRCFATVSRTWGLFSLTPEELGEVEAAHVCKSKRRSSPEIRSGEVADL